MIISLSCPTDGSGWAIVIDVEVWVVIVVIILIRVTASVTIVVGREGSPVLSSIRTLVEMVWYQVSVVIDVLKQVIATIAISIDSIRVHRTRRALI